MMWNLRALPKVTLQGCRNICAGVFNRERECFLSSQDDIATIYLNRPERKNAIGKVFLSQFGEILQFLKDTSKYRALIIASSTPKYFCVGADLKERAEMTQEEVEPFVDSLRSTFSALEALPIPTIAAIEGFALGGGLELALACDLRYASAGAKLGLPETKLAILPAAGGSQRLPRLIGMSKAKELIFTGRIIAGNDAKIIGLVNDVTESEQNSIDWALEIAKAIQKNGPLAIKNAKIAINQGISKKLQEGLEIEKQCYARLIPTSDRLEGLQAFKEGREPIYRGN